MTNVVALPDEPMSCMYTIAICARELTLLTGPYSPRYMSKVYVARLVGKVDISPKNVNTILLIGK